MTFKQLEAFYWAASCNNFSVAATRLNISVSSLSKRISELEGLLNAELFSRSARHAVLTPFGKELLPYALNVLRSADQFQQQATKAITLSGRCRFGVGELTSLTWLPKMIARVQQRHPDLRVETTVAVGQQLEEELEAGELDFAIIAGPSTRSVIASYIIGEANFEWVMAATRKDQESEMRPESLVSERLVTLPRGAGTVRILDDWLTQYQVTPAQHLFCENLGALAGMIQQGLAVGFLPSAWAESLIRRGDLIRLQHFPKLRPLSYAFQWRRDDSRLLIQQLRTIAQDSIHFDQSVCWS